MLAGSPLPCPRGGCLPRGRAGTPLWQHRLALAWRWWAQADPGAAGAPRDPARRRKPPRLPPTAHPRTPPPHASSRSCSLPAAPPPTLPPSTQAAGKTPRPAPPRPPSPRPLTVLVRRHRRAERHAQPLLLLVLGLGAAGRVGAEHRGALHHIGPAVNLVGHAHLLQPPQRGGEGRDGSVSARVQLSALCWARCAGSGAARLLRKAAALGPAGTHTCTHQPTYAHPQGPRKRTLAMVLATARMPTRTAALGPALPLGMEDCREAGRGSRGPCARLPTFSYVGVEGCSLGRLLLKAATVSAHRAPWDWQGQEVRSTGLGAGRPSCGARPQRAGRPGALAVPAPSAPAGAAAKGCSPAPKWERRSAHLPVDPAGQSVDGERVDLEGEQGPAGSARSSGPGCWAPIGPRLQRRELACPFRARNLPAACLPAPAALPPCPAAAAGLTWGGRWAGRGRCWGPRRGGS